MCDDLAHARRKSPRRRRPARPFERRDDPRRLFARAPAYPRQRHRENGKCVEVVIVPSAHFVHLALTIFQSIRVFRGEVRQVESGDHAVLSGNGNEFITNGNTDNWVH